MDTDITPTLDPRRWIAFAVVLAAGFMDLLDVTIVNVAVPSIQKDLGAAYSEIEWIIAAYVLSFAAVLITGGRLGDIYGRKRLFLVGIAGFTAASLACGVASSPALLIGSRFVQGAMAGLMVPQILAIIRVTFPKEERAKAIAVYSGVGGSASAVGLSLGGLLVQWNLFDLGWRPIFLVNVPIGIAALAAAAVVMRDSRSAHAPKLDIVGMVLAVSAVLLLVYPLTEGRRLDWPAWTFVMIGASALAFVAFGVYERWRSRTTGSPLVDPALFRSRPFTVGLASWLLFWIGFGGFFLIWTLFMQAGLGWSPMRAGLTSVFFAVGAGIGAGVSVSVLAPRFGKWVLLGGGLVTMAGFGLYGAMAAHYESDFASWQMVLPLIVTGIGFGIVVAPTIDMLLGQIPDREAGAASGLLNTGQQLGMALGVALVGILFFAQLDHDSARGVDSVAAQTRTELSTTGVPGPAQDQILAGFRACVRDRSAEVDPSVVPASCQSTPAMNAGVGQVLGHAGAQANAVNFAHTFDYTMMWGIGLMALVCVGFLALPRETRLEQHEIEADEDELVTV
ncbi:DHA2 family efflux MFS transporter permease subunit [Nocardia sp. ET3-3]|uniref:DHA2 family efflux MFS transporter permease subunit n=1 Tax=Nocardia terrae TaxID=2675851 RepID=A0A7K1V0W3_9NOCA|nr:MFS transporter [Nocardia terrae]MVU80142.1 DHA2 family efflux MFS transporter permease subunit [Nocardia terrae]